MTKVSIINKEIDNINLIKEKLEERDAAVSYASNLEEIADLQTDILVLSKNFCDNCISNGLTYF